MSEELRFEAERAIVSEQGREMTDKGLTTGTGGNLSERIDENKFAISPSGIPYHDITPEMVLTLNVEGEVLDGDLKPSEETPIHSEIYRNRPEVGAVVHTHSPYASTFASLGQEIPPSHYLISYIGHKIPLAGFRMPGSNELGKEAADALGEDYNACLLQNHGVIAVGNTAEDAIETAQMVEFVSRIHYQAVSIGDPIMVPDEAIDELSEYMSGYQDLKK